MKRGEALSWELFAAAEPEMARLLRSLLGWIPIAYIATVRRDGSPRVHPFCPIFAGAGNGSLQGGPNIGMSLRIDDDSHLRS